jgi:hypothetical protein
MRKELVCPRCEGVVFWHIRALQEHTGSTPKALAVEVTAAAAAIPFHRPLTREHAKGYFELLACEACQHVEWYACDFDGEGREVRPFACPACTGERAWHVRSLDERSYGNSRVAPLPVLTTRTGSDGYYSLAICCACGYTAFTAHALDAVVEFRDGVRVEKQPCACGEPARLRIVVAEEHAGPDTVPLHLSRSGRWLKHDVGMLSPLVCRRCGATEWRALELSRLRDDPAEGVARLDGGARRAGLDGGPYR